MTSVSTTDRLRHVDASSSSATPSSRQAVFSYETASTVAAAANVATAWTAVPLATTVSNNTPATLVATVVNVPAGTYKVQAFASAANCGGSFQTRLVVSGGTSPLALGSSAHSAAATVLARSDLEATVEGPLALQLQYYAAGVGTLGLPNAAPSTNAVHARLSLTRV